MQLSVTPTQALTRYQVRSQSLFWIKGQILKQGDSICGQIVIHTKTLSLNTSPFLASGYQGNLSAVCVCFCECVCLF